LQHFWIMPRALCNVSGSVCRNFPFIRLCNITDVSHCIKLLSWASNRKSSTAEDKGHLPTGVP
jgi:hypothetical protein